MHKYILKTLMFSLVCSFSQIAKSACNSEDDSSCVQMLEMSEDDMPIRLVFPKTSIDQSIRSVKICSDEPAVLEKATLWMPSMGHGSVTPKIMSVSATCSVLTRVVFSMSGDWELRLQFKGGDKIVFAFDVL